MTFKEKLDALRALAKGGIKPESSEEEIAGVNDVVAKLDDIEKDYDALNEENAKFKDTIVRMVSTQGSNKPPVDEEQGSKPISAEDLVKQFQAEQEQKGGK